MTTTESALTPDVRNGIDFKVADLSLADYGRRDIELSEQEMPGLMSLRREYHDVQPLKGARISGSLHMTVQTAVLTGADELRCQVQSQICRCSGDCGAETQTFRSNCF